MLRFWWYELSRKKSVSTYKRCGEDGRSVLVGARCRSLRRRHESSMAFLVRLWTIRLRLSRLTTNRIRATFRAGTIAQLMKWWWHERRQEWLSEHEWMQSSLLWCPAQRRVEMQETLDKIDECGAIIHFYCGCRVSVIFQSPCYKGEKRRTFVHFNFL